MNAWEWSSRRLRIAAAGAGCVLCFGCGDAEPAPTGAPMAVEKAAAPSPSPTAPRIRTVTLDPERPQPGQRIQATVEPVDAEGLRYEYEWRVDGNRTGESGASFHVEGAAGKGSEVEVEVVAVDAENRRSPPVVASARIGNSPPILHGVMIEPLGEINAGSDVTAVPKASDPDGDELSFEYRWDVNGETVDTSGATLAAEHYARGDQVVVTVIASDGEMESEELQSDPIDVANAAPRIVSTPGGFDDEGRFRYEVKAEDADGDASFRYRLLEGPPGMEFDLASGAVEWAPRQDQAGRHPVEIEVKDLHGGRATQSFVMELDFVDPGAEAEAAATPAAPDPAS